MKIRILLSALLLTSAPVYAQYNAGDDCVFNKASEIQRLESELQKRVKETEEPGIVDSLANQLIFMGQLSKDASACKKKERALWFIEGSRGALQKNIDALNMSPDCSIIKLVTTLRKAGYASVSALAFINARAIWPPPDAPECPGESSDRNEHPQNHRHKLNSCRHPIPGIQIAEKNRDNHSYVIPPYKCPGERQHGENHRQANGDNDFRENGHERRMAAVQTLATMCVARSPLTQRITLESTSAI